MPRQVGPAERPKKLKNEMKSAFNNLAQNSQDMLKLVNDNAADHWLLYRWQIFMTPSIKIQEGWYGEGKKEHEHH